MSRLALFTSGKREIMPREQPQLRLPAEQAIRVFIERIRPRIDCGRFPITRTVGEKVVVSAYIFADGHDLLQAVLQFRHAAGDWVEMPMTAFPDDRWVGE